MKIVNEDIANLNRVVKDKDIGARVHLNPVMADAIEDSIETTKEIDKEMEKHNKNTRTILNKVLGAEKQPVPDLPKTPKSTLDESLFEEVNNEDLTEWSDSEVIDHIIDNFADITGYDIRSVFNYSGTDEIFDQDTVDITSSSIIDYLLDKGLERNRIDDLFYDLDDKLSSMWEIYIPNNESLNEDFDGSIKKRGSITITRPELYSTVSEEIEENEDFNSKQDVIDYFSNNLFTIKQNGNIYLNPGTYEYICRNEPNILFNFVVNNNEYPYVDWDDDALTKFKFEPSIVNEDYIESNPEETVKRILNKEIKPTKDFISINDRIDSGHVKYKGTSYIWRKNPDGSYDVVRFGKHFPKFDGSLNESKDFDPNEFLNVLRYYNTPDKAYMDLYKRKLLPKGARCDRTDNSIKIGKYSFSPVNKQISKDPPKYEYTGSWSSNYNSNESLKEGRAPEKLDLFDRIYIELCMDASHEERARKISRKEFPNSKRFKFDDEIAFDLEPGQEYDDRRTGRVEDNKFILNCKDEEQLNFAKQVADLYGVNFSNNGLKAVIEVPWDMIDD